MNLPSKETSVSSTHPTNKSLLVKGGCSNCGLKDRLLFHYVVIRGEGRRICTSCVLRLHPSTFCPYCFEFLKNPLSASTSVSCVKCSSVAHTQCVPSPPPSPSTCPPCSQPNFTFFPVPGSPLDVKLARVLLCASQVALASVNKSAAISRARVEKACKASAEAREKAKEALLHCDCLRRWHDHQDGGSPEVPDSKNVELETGANDNKIVPERENFNGVPQERPKNGPRNRNGVKEENDSKAGNQDCSGSCTFDATPKPEKIEKA